MEIESTAELAPSGVTKGPADPAMVHYKVSLISVFL